MKTTQTEIADILILEPKIFKDDRGLFMETYNRRTFRETIGLDVEFVQDNHSTSKRGVIRGLHYQVRQAQGKLVRVVSGEVFDVAVDLRRSSPTFGMAAATHLDAGSRRMVWIPPGFAHGYLVLSDWAEFLYKTTEYYAPQYERCLLWNDPALGIQWPLQGSPVLSAKDANAPPLAKAELFP